MIQENTEAQKALFWGLVDLLTKAVGSPLI